jgi:hypothetical protein
MEVNFILKLDQVTTLLRNNFELEVLGIERCKSQDQIVGYIEVSKFRSKFSFSNKQLDKH